MCNPESRYLSLLLCCGSLVISWARLSARSWMGKDWAQRLLRTALALQT
jgi:hypothetical protein